MLNFKDFNTENIKNLYLYFLTFYAVSLSYTIFFDIPTKYIVYSLALFYFLNLPKFITNNIKITFIFLILIFQLLIQNPSNIAITSLVISIALFILVYENINFFEKNLIKIFYYSFFFITIYLILVFCLDQDIKDQIFDTDKWGRNSFERGWAACVGLSLNNSNLFFSEASHIAMSYVTLFGSFLFYEKNLKMKIIFTLIYSIICLMIYSTTIWISNIILLLFVLFFYKKNFVKEQLLFFLPVILLSIFVLSHPQKCLQKIYELKFNIKNENAFNLFEKNPLNNVEKNKNPKQVNKVKINIEASETEEWKSLYRKELEKLGKKKIEDFSFREKQNFLNRVDNLYLDINNWKKRINPTTFTLRFHTELVLKNLKINPFGKGFNNYEKNFKILESHKVNTLDAQKRFINLNYNDASSNMIKLIGEFGLILIILLLIFFYFLQSKSIDKKLKIICLTLVATQLLRGTGYFNSGFILIGFIMICLSIKSYNTPFKKNFNSSN
jgi:hypothetical protein